MVMPVTVKYPKIPEGKTRDVKTATNNSSLHIVTMQLPWSSYWIGYGQFLKVNTVGLGQLQLFNKTKLELKDEVKRLA
ncbi:hypothetical protein Pmani_032778 [Petrolisthes manimaculis]|uniref:Uncharacterized protein n=1 Tax=Petrolisthes manimaculis TaxID=1843537 RepID=A0AAE1TTF2_9EUCA|nr:hypothetical protein Pmani_032778 [Petrolisthes manimaculis]